MKTFLLRAAIAFARWRNHWRCFSRDRRTRYLLQAVDLPDLERRMRHWDRHEEPLWPTAGR
jgi:hypothetical protein